MVKINFLILNSSSMKNVFAVFPQWPCKNTQDSVPQGNKTNEKQRESLEPLMRT